MSVKQICNIVSDLIKLHKKKTKFISFNLFKDYKYNILLVFITIILELLKYFEHLIN